MLTIISVPVKLRRASRFRCMTLDGSRTTKFPNGGRRLFMCLESSSNGCLSVLATSSRHSFDGGTCAVIYLSLCNVCARSPIIMKKCMTLPI